MTFFRRLLVLGLFLVVGASSGLAQIGNPIGMYASSGTLNVYGLDFAITSCTYGQDVSSAPTAGTGCSSTDGLELQGVQSGRDTISVKVLATSSAALTQALDGNGTYLNLTISVTKGPSGYGTPLASGALLTAVGVDSYKTSGLNSCSTCTATFTTQALNTPTKTAYLTTSPLSPSSNFSNEYSSTSAQTYTSTVDALTSATNSFYFNENLSIMTSGSDPTSTLKLSSVAMKFYTAPEPASISAMLVGLAGLLLVWRRRGAA